MKIFSQAMSQVCTFVHTVTQSFFTIRAVARCCIHICTALCMLKRSTHFKNPLKTFENTQGGCANAVIKLM